MKATYIFLVILIVLLSLVFDYLTKRQKKKLTGHLISLLMAKKFSEFDQLIKSARVKKWLPQYNLLFLNFNSFVLRGWTNKANQIFDQMQHFRLSSRQSLDFYGQALNYYIKQHDNNRSEKCDQKIKKIKGYKQEKNYLHSLYRILVKNEIGDEATIKQRLQLDDKQTKVTDYYLLAHISEVKKDFAQAKKYNQLADQTITDIVK